VNHQLIKPLRGHIVVQRNESNKQTEGGLYIPEDAQKKLNRGRVVAVGDGRVLDDGKALSPECKEGDEVLFRDAGVLEVELSGDTFVVLDERMILGRIVDA
jgi:chaperonin GroES